MRFLSGQNVIEPRRELNSADLRPSFEQIGGIQRTRTNIFIKKHRKIGPDIQWIDNVSLKARRADQEGTVQTYVKNVAKREKRKRFISTWLFSRLRKSLEYCRKKTDVLFIQMRNPREREKF